MTVLTSSDPKNKQFQAQKGDAAYGRVWDIYRNSFDNNEEEFVRELVGRFRSNMEFLSFNDLQNAATTLREFEQETLANTLIDEYFSCRNTEKDVENIRTLERTIFAKDLTDNHLLSRLQDVWKSKEIDTRSLADVLREIIAKEYPSLKDINRMNSFSVDDYYDFFKTEKSKELYFYVRKCLDFEKLHDEEGIYKSISEKAKLALDKIASESRINRKRVMTLYNLDVSKEL